MWKSQKKGILPRPVRTSDADGQCGMASLSLPIGESAESMEPEKKRIDIFDKAGIIREDAVEEARRLGRIRQKEAMRRTLKRQKAPQRHRSFESALLARKASFLSN